MKMILWPISGVLVNGLTLWLLTFLVSDIQYTGGLKFFILGGIVIGLINFFVKPFLKLLSLPLVIVTGGLFLIVINMGILWFLSYFISVINFQDITLVFPNFLTYVIGAIVFGVINWILNQIIK